MHIDPDVFKWITIRGQVELLDKVCAEHGVSRAEICGRASPPIISHARQDLWYRLYHHPERYFSYPDIGKGFKRNHTTIISGVRAHEKRLAKTVHKLKAVS